MGLISRLTGGGVRPRIRAFDAGKSGRRLRGLPTTRAAINAQIRTYGATVLARSRYLAANNPYAASAKETFTSALVGTGIKPSSLVEDAALKETIQRVWLGWTDEADADGRTDFFGLQAVIAAEMFEAGEVFVRLRPRRPEDGLSVPLQLQLLPAEMLPLADNRVLDGGERRVESGIEFDALGRRRAYHFLTRHPGDDQARIDAARRSVVPADEVLHLFKPIRAGQIRGLPHTTPAIVTAAIMDQYEDAELERKRMAALFAAFITRPAREERSPLENDSQEVGGETPSPAPPEDSVPFEPGAMVDLAEGEEVKFAEPADVGGNYEAFVYRNLLRQAAGYGVPYAQMTGDMRQANFSSIRAGLVEFRRRVEAMQHHVMVFQLCRPVWLRWFADAVMAGALPIAPSAFAADPGGFTRAKWMPPKWEWVDPEKDIRAELRAVRAGFKSRSDVIEETGEDPEAVDARIAADQARADAAGFVFDSDARHTSGSGVTQSRGGEFPLPGDEPGDEPGDDAGGDGAPGPGTGDEES